MSLVFEPYRKLMGIIGARDGLLLPPRRKAYQPKGLTSPPDENTAAGQRDRASQRGKVMAGDDKKIKTDPAPKTEAPPENKSTNFG
jgi:hypothetical protein